MKNFQDVVPTLLDMFANENFPAQLALTIIKRDNAIPSDAWSITNRLIMHIIGATSDARTYKQWQAVKRQAKKGEKAFGIIAPVTKKFHNEETDKDEIRIIGFRALPVFAYEATEGEPLPECDCTPTKLPPFFDAAEALGIQVSWKPLSRNAYGYYRLSDRSITLHSQDYAVFFHELAHAVHDTIEPLKDVPDDKAEVVAELTAAVMCEMAEVSGYQQQSYEYIKQYVQGKDNKAIMKAIADVLALVEQIVSKVVAAAAVAVAR